MEGDPPRDLVVLVFPIRGPDGALIGQGRLVRDVTRTEGRTEGKTCWTEEGETSTTLHATTARYVGSG
jgi:hypothetical protein